MEDINGAVAFLTDLLAKADTMFVQHGRRMYLLSDPEVPVDKVAAVFKSQLTDYVKATKEAN